MPLGSWIRDRRRRRQLRRWEASNEYPAQVRRRYWASSKLERDSARLTAHGYHLVDELDGGGPVDVAPAQNIFYTRDISNRLLMDRPLAVVTFERRPS